MQNHVQYRQPTHPHPTSQGSAFPDLSYESAEYYEDDESHGGLYGAFAFIAIIIGVLAVLLMA